jgi:uracil-DNA glycosylase
MPQVGLTLLVGGHAQRWALKTRRSLTETVHDWRSLAPTFIPLPHPSWRNNGWLRRNPWFAKELLPDLRSTMARML